MDTAIQNNSNDPKSIDDWLDLHLSSDGKDWNVVMLFALTKIETAFVKQRASFFKANFEAADEFVQLPYFLAALPEVKSDMEKVSGHLQKAVAIFPSVKSELHEIIARLPQFQSLGANAFEGLNLSEDFKSILEDALECIVIYMSYQGKSGSEKAKKALRPVIEVREETKLSIEQMHRASASALWTAFEVLAADLWEDSLNNAAESLAPRVLKEKGIQETEGLSHKQISVDLLSKHQFDLRSVMGTLLKPKFDFSGANGIEKAFCVLFSLKSLNWDDELRTKLLTLEQTRHVIQHRAGIADQKYSDFTKGAVSVGSRIIITADELEGYKEAIIEASWSLISRTDAWFKENAPILSNSKNSTKALLNQLLATGDKQGELAV